MIFVLFHRGTAHSSFERDLAARDKIQDMGGVEISLTCRDAQALSARLCAGWDKCPLQPGF